MTSTTNPSPPVNADVSATIKPCPFCGHEDCQIESNYPASRSSAMVCQNCQAKGPQTSWAIDMDKVRDEILLWWNDRSAA